MFLSQDVSIPIYTHTHMHEWWHNKGSNMIIRYVRTGNLVSLTCTFFGVRGLRRECPGVLGLLEVGLLQQQIVR